MTIDNQCTSIKLTSLVYFSKDEICPVLFPQQVNSMSIMKANFKTGINQNTFDGALLYHLQDKVDVSICTQLLIIWGYKSNRPYSHTLLIEHDSTLVWNRYKLKRLYDVYHSQCDVFSNIEQWLNDNTSRWSLNHNTSLRTGCKSLHGGFKMNITISEGKYQVLLQKPLWVDPDR
jgi:hypothetical protein